MMQTEQLATQPPIRGRQMTDKVGLADADFGAMRPLLAPVAGTRPGTALVPVF